jgi:hypothetical protein
MADASRPIPPKSDWSQDNGSSPHPILSIFPTMMRTIFIKKEGARTTINDKSPIRLYRTRDKVRMLFSGHSPVLQKARKSCIPSKIPQAFRTLSPSHGRFRHQTRPRRWGQQLLPCQTK